MATFKILASMLTLAVICWTSVQAGDQTGSYVAPARQASSYQATAYKAPSYKAQSYSAPAYSAPPSYSGSSYTAPVTSYATAPASAYSSSDVGIPYPAPAYSRTYSYVAPVYASAYQASTYSGRLSLDDTYKTSAYQDSNSVQLPFAVVADKLSSNYDSSGSVPAYHLYPTSYSGIKYHPTYYAKTVY